MNQTLPPEVIDEIERLNKAATPEPWVLSQDGCHMTMVRQGDPYTGRRIATTFVTTGAPNTAENEDNAACIVALRNHAPALIAKCREADEYAKQLERIRSERLLFTKNQEWGMQLLEKLGAFANETMRASTPMTTQIVASINGEDTPVLHLWATTSDKEPAARCRELADQLRQRDDELRQARADGEARQQALCKARRAIGSVYAELPSKHLLKCLVEARWAIDEVADKPHPGAALADENARLRDRLEKAEQVANRGGYVQCQKCGAWTKGLPFCLACDEKLTTQAAALAPRADVAGTGEEVGK